MAPVARGERLLARISRMKELSVKNFKSLKDLELKFDKFNVLIGRNAAGKSNIISCLQYLSRFVRGSREKPLLSEEMSFERATYRGEVDKTIETKIKLDNGFYSFAWSKSGDYREDLTINGKELISGSGQKTRGIS